MLQDRQDPLCLSAVERSVNKALSQARITHDEIDLFELHDAYTILSAMSLEAAGFAERGHGWELAQNSQLGLEGQVPISTFGGLKSRGNPAAASGVYQAVEASLQLRNEAGNNQVKNAKVAMIQNLGGLASTAISHILQI
jgi:acetyl-CoA C-acetyltransferase